MDRIRTNHYACLSMNNGIYLLDFKTPITPPISQKEESIYHSRGVTHYYRLILYFRKKLLTGDNKELFGKSVSQTFWYSSFQKHKKSTNKKCFIFRRYYYGLLTNLFSFIYGRTMTLNRTDQMRMNLSLMNLMSLMT